MIYFHGRDARAAAAIESNGLRAGSHVTDSRRWATHYARRSSGAARSAGAVLAVEVVSPAGFLLDGPIDPDALGSSVWRLARDMPARTVLRIGREQSITAEDQEWYSAIAAARQFERPTLTDPRTGAGRH